MQEIYDGMTINPACTGRGYAPRVSGTILQIQLWEKPCRSEKCPAGEAPVMKKLIHLIME